MDTYQSKIIKIEKLAEGVYSYCLEIPSGITWHAGAHMHVALPGYEEEGKAYVKHMSIASSMEDNEIRFITRIGEMPSVYKKKLSELKVGDSVTLFKFSSILKLDDERDVVMLTQGVGITAVYPLLRERKAKPAVHKVVSLNVAREDILVDETNATKLPQDIFTWCKNSSAFRQAFQPILLDRESVANAQFIIVGKEQFMLDTMNALKQAGVTADQIVLDKKEEKKQMFLTQVFGA